jgi:hypothetical protein
MFSNVVTEESVDEVESPESIDTISFFTTPHLLASIRAQNLGFFRLTTAGLNTTYYSRPKMWTSLHMYPVAKSCFSDQDFELRQIIGNLIERTSQLDCSLCKDLKGASAFSICKTAFRELGPTNVNGDIHWQKEFFIPLLLDRLLWVEHCINNPSGPVPLPFQTPHDTYSTPNETLDVLADLETNWFTVIQHFVEGWKGHSSTPITVDNSPPLKSLYDGIERSENNIHAAKVTRNFCLVALAIRSLLIVSI